MSATISRLEAEGLAALLPAALLEARRLAASAAGVHGRRRAGQGEAFWQFRDHRPEDGLRAVDWRRSGRGDRLFVREREREAAQTFWIWVDPSPGFAWRSSESAPEKRLRGATIALASAILFHRAGERVGLLGGPAPRRGAGAIDRLAEDIAAVRLEEPPAPPMRSAVLFTSDFYDDPAIWKERLGRAGAAGVTGALLMVADPAEEDFPFRGRTLFEEPGGGRSVLFGRAEQAQSEYASRLAAHRAQIRAIAQAHGFSAVLHRTDRPAGPALTALVAALEERP